MSTADVDVVGQDQRGVTPDEAEPSGHSGEIRRAIDNIRAGNLGVLPIVMGLIFVQVFSPPRRCFVVGAVLIAQPLVQMLSLADYQPIVIDPLLSADEAEAQLSLAR